VAILLPSLKQARGQARRAACLSNLHQIHLASVAYAHSSNDRLPDKITLGGSRRMLPSGSEVVSGHGFRVGVGYKYPRTTRERCGRPLACLPFWASTAALSGVRRSGSVRQPQMDAGTGKHLWGVHRREHYEADDDPTAARQEAGLPDLVGVGQLHDDAAPSGFRVQGGSIPSIPTEKREYPHSYARSQLSSSPHKACNCVYLDGHAAPIRFQD